MKLSVKLEIIVLSIILLLGFLVRLYRFDGPIADWHSWRQADTSAVSRDFVNYGFNLLVPTYNDLSNVPTHALDNPKGYRFVEFPIYNFFQGFFFKYIGFLTLEEWGRLISIFSSLTSAVFLYLIFAFRKKNLLGILSAFFYLFIPYNIYYGRTILPDPSMVMVTLGSIYFFQRWLSYPKFTIYNLQFTISLIFMIAAFLLKPYAVFFTLPLFALAYEKFGFEMFRKWQFWVYAVVSILPLFAWRIWMLQYPEGIPTSSWLLNSNHIRFRPAFFRWIFYERLTKLISGYLGVVIFAAGIISLKSIKDWLFFASFGISSLLYVIVFATGNVTHDYYQILVMPSVAIFFALGTLFLYKWKYKDLGLGKVILVVSLMSLLIFGWSQVKDYFNINNRSIVAAGEAVDRLTPKNAKVIANYNGDTSFLYQTKRKGWASFEKPMNDMINMGASYLILVNPTPTDLEIGKTYKIVAATKQYVIFNLLEKP